MKSSASRSRMDVDLEELDGIIDGALRAPLSESDGRKLKTALHAMAERLVQPRTTEKAKAVLPKPEHLSSSDSADTNDAAPEGKGHGRNGASAFSNATALELILEAGIVLFGNVPPSGSLITAGKTPMRIAAVGDAPCRTDCDARLTNCWFT